MSKATDPNSLAGRSPGRDGDAREARRALSARITAADLRRWREAEYDASDERTDESDMASDDDLILLEAYLDDELSDAEQAALRARLAVEPALASALADVKAERTARQAVWASMEPNDGEIRSLVANVQHATRRREVFLHRLRRAGQVTAAAACVLIGLAVGWQSRPAQTPVGADVVATNDELKELLKADPNAPQYVSSNPAPEEASADRQIQFVGRVMPVRTEPRTVVMTDHRGRVVAVNHFASPDEAREFVADMAQRGLVPSQQLPQSRVSPVRPPQPADAHIVPVSADQF